MSIKDGYPILCLDFDGVLHSYISGWCGARTIPDPPVRGAIPWLRGLLTSPDHICSMAPRYRNFDVQIYSSRSHQFGGRRAMKKWLEYWFARYGYESGLTELIKFPRHKPPAKISLDDRALNFQGTFPKEEDLLNFKPWNEKGL